MSTHLQSANDNQPEPRGEAEPLKGKSCVICGKPQLMDYKPFCSKRCADIDLARWLGGTYAIPTAPADDEEH
jgi:uncharacterized protein